MKACRLLIIGLALSLMTHCYGQNFSACQGDYQGKMMTIKETLEKRHSGRSYDPSRSVTQEQIKLLAEASRLSPSCYNDQPWRFIICDRHQNPDAYQKALSSLVEFNQGWAKNAPILVIVAAHAKFERNGELNRWGAYDTGAAAFAMMLQATDLGLMAHQMGGFDANKIQKEFEIPAEFTPLSVMAIGYQSQAEANASTPKDRKPLSDHFFMGKWGQ